MRKYQTGQETFKYFLIWVIALLALKFYTVFLNYSLGRAVALLAVIIVISIYPVFAIYDKSSSFKRHFNWPILLMTLGVIASSFAADLFYSQPLKGTLFQENVFYLYAFYFLLHKLKPTPEKIVNIIVGIGLIYCFIYFIQYLLYPRLIIGSIIMKDRGTLRIFLPGSEFLVAAYFIELNRYFNYKKIKYLLWMIPMFVVFLLLGTRQVLATVVLLTLLNILLSKKIKSKFWMFFILALCIVPIFFIFQDIFIKMFEVTQKQSKNASGNIRVQAATYFMFHFNNNRLWMLTGNGYPDPHASYGRDLSFLTGAKGYFLADIGIIAEFFMFGIFYVIGKIGFLIMFAKGKFKEEFSFIRYFALADILTIVTGLTFNADTIIFYCILMYIFDLNKRILQTET